MQQLPGEKNILHLSAPASRSTLCVDTSTPGTKRTSREANFRTSDTASSQATPCMLIPIHITVQPETPQTDTHTSDAEPHRERLILDQRTSSLGTAHSPGKQRCRHTPRINGQTQTHGERLSPVQRIISMRVAISQRRRCCQHTPSDHNSIRPPLSRLGQCSLQQLQSDS